MGVCEVPGCPALAEARQATCAVHARARLARELNIAQSARGRGGQRCVACARLFEATDWVLREPQRRASRKRQPGTPYGYVHVACEPTSPRLSKRKLREAEKPLLAGLS